MTTFNKFIFVLDESHFKLGLDGMFSLNDAHFQMKNELLRVIEWSHTLVFYCIFLMNLKCQIMQVH